MSDKDKPATREPASDPIQDIAKPQPIVEAKSTATPAPLDFRGQAPIAFHIDRPEGTHVLAPGLNLVDGTVWDGLSKHPPFAALLGTELHRVDLASLDAAQRLDLVARTTQAASLAHLHANELAKPAIAGPIKRRDPAVLDAIGRKLAKLRA